MPTFLRTLRGVAAATMAIVKRSARRDEAVR